MTGTRNLKMWLTICSLLTALVGTAAGGTIHVPGDYSTIQAAINAADSGDQIEVAPGTYSEAIDFTGKAIRLYSSGGPEVTTIDATGIDASVVSCTNGEGSGTILEGFTITGGSGTLEWLGKIGGGMRNIGSSPTVIKCTFRGNQAYAGGGMCNTGGSPTVTNCTFSDNTALWTYGGAGGGMFNDGGSNAAVTNCLFSGNYAPWGGAMANYAASPTVTNCTFSKNTGGIPGMYNEAGSNPTVTNSILWGNGWELQYQIVNVSDSTPVVTYSDVQYAYAGTGNNIDADPMFRDALNGDYRLLFGSPCIDAGNNEAVVGVETDLDGNPRIQGAAVNMGPYELAVADFFLHGVAPGLTLDNAEPTSATTTYEDSPSVNRTAFKEIGTWTYVVPSAMDIQSLGDLHVWVGLKNSDDQGTHFDIRAELLKNGTTVASGQTLDIRGVTRNPSYAKEVAVAFGAIDDGEFSPDDALSLLILTKVTAAGGHNNAVGLRLYYDSLSRPSACKESLLP